MSNIRAMHKAAVGLYTSDELIAHYRTTTDLAPEIVAAIIKAGVDTLYEMRNEDAVMHGAGAAAAIEAVMIYRRYIGALPARFRDDYDLPEPYTDPVSGIDYPVNPIDVLDPQEYAEYQRERRSR